MAAVTTDDIAELRLAIQANGYSPVPAYKKCVFLEEWPDKLNVPQAEVRQWSQTHPQWRNTGIITSTTPTVDVDISHPEAAQTVATTIRDWFDGRGVILERFGSPPKRAIPFRTKQPFKKMLVRFVDPAGSVHKIEILGDGQQFIAAGIHPNTRKEYTWHADNTPWSIPRADLPELNDDEAFKLLNHLAETLIEQHEFQVESAPPYSENDTPTARGARVDAEAELAAMRYRPNAGVVNDTHCRVIPSLLRRGHEPDEVIDMVVAGTMSMARELNLGWSHAAEVAQVTARCVSTLRRMQKGDDYTLTPPWLPTEYIEEWARIVASGKRPLFTRNGAGWHLRAYGDKPHEDAPAEPGTSAKKNGTAPPKRILVLRPFVKFDPAALPPRAWLYGKHYQRRTVSLTAGPGGMGKSSLEMVELLSMATGRNLLGEQPMERLRVWLHNGEDPMEEMLRRLAAVCQHYKIPQEELQGQLWLTSGNEFPLRVAKGYANLEIDEPLVRQISNAIGENEIDVAAFDPLVTLHSVSEGDPGKMDAVVRLFAGIADERDAGIDLSHHVRKPAAGSDADLDLNDIRGVMAITDAARAARILNRMNKADATDAGIGDVGRLSYFRVDKVKGNYSPAQAATWRRFKNVDLPNNDEVGVVEPWDFPGQGMATPEKVAADQRAEQVFLELLDKFTGRGVNVSANQGPNYAPAKFAGDKTATAAKVAKAALRAAMDRLLDRGWIRSVPFGRSDRNSYRLVRDTAQ
jgi:RecA-family ATPase